MATDSDGEALRMLYQTTTADLSYFKMQQWSVTYYAFLIDAGLIGIAELLSPGLQTADRIVLAALACGATVAALVVLSKLQKSIAIRQSRLESLRVILGTAFERAWSAEYKGPELVHSIYLLVGGVVTTAVLTLWLLVYRLGAV